MLSFISSANMFAIIRERKQLRNTLRNSSVAMKDNQDGNHNKMAILCVFLSAHLIYIYMNIYICE